MLTIRFLKRVLCLFVALHAAAPTVVAGMPVITLTDVGRLRISTISFFAMVILATAWGIRRLWNGVSKDFARMPQLSYRGAVAGVLLWGLVFVIVLTMISGARELMTPGAWEKNGLTYQLSNRTQPPDQDWIGAEVSRQLNEKSQRMQQLQLLGLELHRFADEFGRFPTVEEFRDLPRSVRQVPGALAADYIYTGPEPDGADDLVLAFEPAVFSDRMQYGLYKSGNILPLQVEETAP